MGDEFTLQILINGITAEVELGEGTLPVCQHLRSLKGAAGTLDWGGLGIFDLPQPTRANQPHHNNQQSAERAALRTDRTSRQPRRAGRTRIQKMTGQRLTTVGHAIEVRLAPVEGHVKPDWHPEIAGSAQQEAGQQSKRPGVE